MMDENIDECEVKNKFKTYRLKDYKLKPFIKEKVAKETSSNKIKRETRIRRKNVQDVSKSIKVDLIKDVGFQLNKDNNDLNIGVTNLPENIIPINLEVSEKKHIFSTNHKYTSKNAIEKFPKLFEKFELESIPEVEVSFADETKSDEKHYISKVDNNIINYFKSKKKLLPEFSSKFLESFVNESKENDLLAKNYDTPKSTSDDKMNSSSKDSRKKSFVFSKKVRTKSVIMKKDKNDFLDLNMKIRSSSLDSVFKTDGKDIKKVNTCQLNNSIKDNNNQEKSDKTFTLYSHPFFRNSICNNEMLKGLNNVKRLHSLEDTSNKTKTVIRHGSYNIFVMNDIKKRNEEKLKENAKENYNYQNIDIVKEKISVVKKSNINDEITHFEEELRNISEKESQYINIISHENHSCYISGNLVYQRYIQPLSSIIEKSQQNVYNNNLFTKVSKTKEIERESFYETQPPKKHIYTELLPNIIPDIINEMVENILTDSSILNIKLEKPLKNIRKQKNKKLINTLKESVENHKNEEIEIKFPHNIEIQKKIYSANNEMLSKVSQNNEYNVRNVSKNLDISEERNNVHKKEIEVSKTYEKEIIDEPILLKRKLKNISQFQSLDNIHSENNDIFNINWKDEAIIPEQVKQTILMYDAQARRLTQEKNSLLEENQQVNEFNKSLQKRNCILLGELKQQKRETAFIKNQIDVMLSRIQSVPEKLEQLEVENSNLKSEINDLERTLDQRDQLFASERQMNASLSEEIVKLEADTVNKELMKNVCEEFENLNEEYENLKHNLEETEDKLFEIIQDRDNLMKHTTLMEENLYKLKNENNYLIQNYQMITSGGLIDPMNNMWSVNNRESQNYGQIDHIKGNEVENKGADSKYSCRPEKEFHNHHFCGRSKYRGHSHKRHSSEVSSTSSSDNSDSSSSDYKRRHKKRKKHSHKHKHKKSHSHHSTHKDRRSRKETDKEIKPEIENQNQNANNEDILSETVIKMPTSREELKKLEFFYDSLQIKKSKMETALSHIPINKGITNTSNMTSMQEQDSLEIELDQCDKKLASLRKILRDCKVFKSIPSMK